MIRLYHAETKKVIGTITYPQWRRMISQEECASEGIYYLNTATLDWLDHDGANAPLARLLRHALAKEDATEIGWVRAMLKAVPTAWQRRGEYSDPVVFEVRDGEHKLAEIDNRAAISVLIIEGISYEACREVGRMTNACVLTLDQREVARAEKQSAFSPWIIDNAELQYTLEEEWGSGSLMEGSTPIGTLSRDGEGISMDSPDTLPPLITTFVIWLFLYHPNW